MTPLKNKCQLQNKCWHTQTPEEHKQKAKSIITYDKLPHWLPAAPEPKGEFTHRTPEYATEMGQVCVHSEWHIPPTRAVLSSWTLGQQTEPVRHYQVHRQTAEAFLKLSW